MSKGITNIPTRLALIHRAEKLLKEIDDYFSDADLWGLSYAESDPDGMMQKMRTGLVSMLIKEGRIKPIPKQSSRTQLVDLAKR